MKMEKIENILQKTDEYLRHPSVTRFEGAFLNFLAEEFNMPGYSVEKGNGILVVKKNNSSNPQILTAHVDRNGLIVNENGKPEYSVFQSKKRSGTPMVSKESLFHKIGPRFIGDEENRETLIAYDKQGSIIAEGEAKSFNVDYDKKELTYEIDGMQGLPAETPIGYKSSLQRDGDMVSSQIDNTIGIAVLYQLVKDGFDGRIIFSTEEECGNSWKHILKYMDNKGIESKEVIVVDTSPYPSIDDFQGDVVFRDSDDGADYNPDLIAKLKGTAERNGISYMMKSRERGKNKKVKGYTELGHLIEETNGRVNGATVQIPSTKYHTNHETTTIHCVNNYYNLLRKI